MTEINPNKPSFQMKTCKVARIIDENYRIKTFELDCNVKGKPGRYIMLWIPGVGERPMSLGNSTPISVTIANVGNFSNAIHKLKEGDLVSFRGPLGKAFNLPKQEAKHKTGDDKRILLVGGGYGVVPLAYLAREAKKKGMTSVAVIGARKKEDVIYADRFKAVGAHVEVTTDDGSLGTTGNAMHGVEKAFKEGHKFDAVYSCGPEKMMHALAKICIEKNIYCELSIERYMKCGINICGACALDGKIICSDGPVFTAKEALKFSEFGSATRDASGKKCGLH